MTRRKRSPADQIYYARGRRSDSRGEQAGYFTPERPRKARSKKATPVTSPAPVKGLNDIPPVA